LHRVDPVTVWNGGIGFSRCLRCWRALVRRPGRRWSKAPRGYAVVWRPAGGKALAERAAGSSAAPVEQASRSYRYLVRRIAAARADGQPARTILLSAMCDVDAANEVSLLLSATLQDELGGRLLIIDATLRNDGIGASLGIDRKPGLSEARAQDPWRALEMLHLLSRKGVFALGAGLDPAAAQADEMIGILPFLAERFDHILIQQRAITADTRNLALAAHADRILVLAKEGSTRMAGLAAARDAFRCSGIGDVGLILTVPDDSRQGRALAA
jgi:Mrp family chromosome partitioning ATPase